MLCAAEKLKNICQLFGYIEITPDDAPSWYDEHKISNHLKQLIGRAMKCVTVKQKDDIWRAFKIMFGNYGGE